jgi:hypothetical protein
MKMMILIFGLVRLEVNNTKIIRLYKRVTSELMMKMMILILVFQRQEINNKI